MFRRLYFFQTLCCILCLVCQGNAVAQPLQATVSFTEKECLIKARDMDLAALLTQMADSFPFSLKTSSLAVDQVTVDIHASSLEKCLELLLADWNYALTYKKKNMTPTPDTLWVFARKPDRLSPNPSNQDPVNSNQESPEPHPPQADQHFKRFPRQKYTAAFENKEVFLNHTHLIPIVIENNSEPAEEEKQIYGIQIEHFTADSILQDIGINAGDVIHDINGFSVSSADELIEIMQAASSDNVQMIRIERTSGNVLDPIYLQLQ